MAVGAGVPLLMLLVVVYPEIHNRHVHPLGRLYGSLAEGQPCAAVAARFRAYANRRSHPELQFTRFTAREDLVHKRPVAAGRGYHLYDRSLFDDVQLTVRCDNEDHVAEMLFIGD